MASVNNRDVSLVRRALGSVWLRMLVFIVLFLLFASLVISGTGTKVQAKQMDFLADSVRRSAVQCYALEGSFPQDLAYLENNYGLIVDHENYAVYYEPMGGNLIPQIRVIPFTK